MPDGSSAAAQIQERVPGARVLKAFNTNFAATLATGQVGPLPTPVLVAGAAAAAEAALAGGGARGRGGGRPPAQPDGAVLPGGDRPEDRGGGVVERVGVVREEDRRPGAERPLDGVDRAPERRGLRHI